ncbi:MAG: nucleoside hydrolase [Pseudomonadota bacterium]
MGIWVDTDMSTDDIFAICVLAAHAPIDGISLTHGVTGLAQVRRNAAGAAAALGWQIPVHHGADQALLGGLLDITHILGETGIRSRGTTLPDAPDRAGPGAVTALAGWLEGQAGASILALGPLTNLAALALIRPDLLTRIARITWMGGGVTSGNHTASAEFNALADPEALAVLLARAVPIRMIDLDACRRVQITEDHVSALRAGSGANSALMADLLGGYLDIALERGRPSMALYDPVAAVALIRPDLFSFAPVRLEAELSGTHTRGRTVVETRHPDTHNAQIATDLDAASILDLCMAAWCAA